MNDITTKVFHDEKEDKTHIYREQDCTPVIDEVKRLKEVTDGRGDGIKGYFVGRIPAIIVERYLNETGVSYREFIMDETHVKRILNDPDYKKFRIFEGTV